MKKTLLTLIGLAALSLAGVQAQVTMTYAFTSNSASSTSGVPLNFTISDFSIGNSLGNVTTPINTSSASNTSNYTIASGTSNIGNAFRTGSLDLATSGYIQVTVTPTTGYALSFTNLDFGVRSTSTGAASFALRSSVDSYATDIFTTSTTANSAWTLKTNAFSYSAPVDTPVTLRLFGYGGAGTPSTGTINTRFDDISITLQANAAAVPEPSTWALIGLGSAFVLWRTRRKPVC
jgi:hypothetical protein